MMGPWLVFAVLLNGGTLALFMVSLAVIMGPWLVFAVLLNGGTLALFMASLALMVGLFRLRLPETGRPGNLQCEAAFLLCPRLDCNTMALLTSCCACIPGAPC
jgi:hypothetical protein